MTSQLLSVAFVFFPRRSYQCPPFATSIRFLPIVHHQTTVATTQRRVATAGSVWIVLFLSSLDHIYSGNVIVRYHCFHIFRIYQFYNFANVYIKQFKRHDSLLNHVSFSVCILIFTPGSPPKLLHLHLKHWSGIAYLPANLRFRPAQPAVYRCYPNQNLLMCRRE